MLAEHGPQDIETARQYFKHWVKVRPREPPLMNNTRFEPGTRSDIRTQPPGDMIRSESRRRHRRPRSWKCS